MTPPQIITQTARDLPYYEELFAALNKHDEAIVEMLNEIQPSGWPARYQDHFDLFSDLGDAHYYLVASIQQVEAIISNKKAQNKCTT